MENPTPYPYIIEMRHITKVFPGIIANDDITLQLKKGEIHALLGENGAGKSTLMSVLFGMYQPERGEILKDGEVVKINDPNDATALGIGMVHQHFKLVDCFTVLQNIILGAEDTTLGFLRTKQARAKVKQLSEQYGLYVDLDARIDEITVGMQQRTEILKMLYRDNEILIFDEPTAVLTPQEIDELMNIMRKLAAEGKSILFITHKLNEIMAVADRCSVLRKGKYIGTVDTKSTTKEELSSMMVGRDVKFAVDKEPASPGEVVLKVDGLTIHNKKHRKDSVHNVSFEVRRGEIVCIAGIDGNGQTELVYGITGLERPSSGKVYLKDIQLQGKQLSKGQKKAIFNGAQKDLSALPDDADPKSLYDQPIPLDIDVTHKSIRTRNNLGLNHIPEDRHKHGLILDFSLEQNMVLQRYFEPEFQRHGFIKFGEIREYAKKLIADFDVRSGQGPITIARSMSGGNQQKAIVGRELRRSHDLLVAVQPTRGLDVGAIEYIHEQIVKDRDEGAAVLLVSLELDEVMNLSDRILVMYEGELVAEVDPKQISVQELGLYMAGAKRMPGFESDKEPTKEEQIEQPQNEEESQPEQSQQIENTEDKADEE